MLLIEEGTDHVVADRNLLPYDLLDNLGHGHSGNVEKVHDRILGITLARKTIWITSARREKEERERIFRNEVKIIRRFRQHHHIIRVWATYITPDQFGIILQPVADEGDLSKFLRRYVDAREKRRLTGSCDYDFASAETTLKQACGCLAGGLESIHLQRVRHKDIKPHNILVHRGSVIYTDFGYSRNCSDFTNSSSEGRPGFLSRRYSAPEVIEHESRSYASDVFSLGCVFIEIVSALCPGFVLDSDAHFASVIGDIHKNLGAAKLPSDMAFLAGTIIMMTLRNAAARTTARQTSATISNHRAFLCGNCFTANQTAARAASTSSLLMPHPLTEPVAHATSIPLRDRYEDLLEDIEDLQDKLRDGREDLLGCRFRLRVRRQELRKLREKSAQDVSMAFDRLRSYLSRSKLDLPADIHLALSAADTTRDNIEVWAREFELAEEAYNLLEWQYTEKETQLIDSLTTDVIRYSHSSDQEASRHNADIIARDRPGYMNLDSPSPSLSSSQKSARLGRISLESPAACMAPQSASDIASFSCALGKAQHSDAGKRIDDWLLETLACSTTQKKRLKDMCSGFDVNDDLWWQLVVQNWMSDERYNLGFHNGDTTSSDGATGRLVSISSKVNQTIDLRTSEQPDNMPPGETPLCLHDRIMDALEDIDHPERIRSSDLDDSGTKVVSFMLRPHSLESVFTQPISMTRASSALDDSSIATAEDYGSCTTSELDESLYMKPKVTAQGVHPEAGVTHLLELLGDSNDEKTLFDLQAIARQSRAARTSEAPGTGPDMMARYIPLELPFHFESPTRADVADLNCQSEGHAMRADTCCATSLNTPITYSLPLLRLTPTHTPYEACSLHSGNVPFVEWAGTPPSLPGPCHN